MKASGLLKESRLGAKLFLNRQGDILRPSWLSYQNAYLSVKRHFYQEARNP